MEDIFYPPTLFAGKKALVVGGTGDIGWALIAKLVFYQAKVTVIGRNEKKLKKLKEDFKGDVTTIKLDITDFDELQKQLDEFKAFDLYAFCAGKALDKNVLNIKNKHLKSVFDVNYMAPFIIGQDVAQKMVNRLDGEGGAIVHVTSVLSTRVFQNHSALASSKSSLDQLTRSMAVELGAKKIRANSVHPANVKSKEADNFATNYSGGNPEILKIIKEETVGRIPLGKYVDTVNVADAIIFLLSDRASMISGTTLVVDGGMTAKV